MGAPHGLVDLAEIVGGLAWWEEQLFATLGGWIPSVPEPDVKVLLATHSAEHAWHADLLRSWLPVLAGLDPADLVRPADPAIADVAGAIASAPTTVARLTGAARIALPRAIVAYRTLLAATTPVADRPLQRALRLVLADQQRHWLEAEHALQRLLRPGDLPAVADLIVRVESRLAVVPGLVPRFGSFSPGP